LPLHPILCLPKTTLYFAEFSSSLYENLPKSGSLENQISQISTNLFIPELPPLCQEKIGAIALLGQVGEKNAGRKPPMHPVCAWGNLHFWHNKEVFQRFSASLGPLAVPYGQGLCISDAVPTYGSFLSNRGAERCCDSVSSASMRKVFYGHSSSSSHCCIRPAKSPKLIMPSPLQSMSGFCGVSSGDISWKYGALRLASHPTCP